MEKYELLDKVLELFTSRELTEYIYVNNMAYARELTDLLVQIDLAYFVNGEEK
jgi:hypothetical protein